MTLATGIGSHPGEDAAAYDEAVRVVLGELSDGGLPYLPELPGRGATASMTGRALALVAGLGADLQPAGWRLTDAVGVDQRRARSLLAQDLDAVEEAAQGYSGPFKVQVAGPWTLAATVERPRGDKLLADHGARRDLAQALAEGVRAHVADVRRRLGGVARLVVQVDEPALPAVLAARIPTASGFGKHRAVDLPVASEAIAWLTAAIEDAGAEPWFHSCAGSTPWSMLTGAGAQGLLADVAVLDAEGVDQLAQALDDEVTVGLGLSDAASDKVVVERFERWLDLVGLDPAEVSDRLVISPACGLAGAEPTAAARTLRVLRQAASALP